MKLLALDTATEACSAAVCIDGRVQGYCEIAGRDHTQRLLPLVGRVLAEAGLGYGQLDGLVCGVGPGSFAGVRIGVAFAKGVALARDLPVLGVTSLQLLAQGAVRRQNAKRVWAAIDARMGEVYFQTWRREADGLVHSAGEAVVCAPGAVSPALEPASAAGTGWGSYATVLQQALGQPAVHIEGEALPEALDALGWAQAQFAAGAAVDAALLQPVYLRNRVALTLHQQAELRAKMRDKAG